MIHPQASHRSEVQFHEMGCIHKAIPGYLVLVALRCYTGCMQLRSVIIRSLILLCSTILNYRYHLCVLEVVALSINNIIV
jgi:hypothetical protein